jgi:hypothetical protein
MVDEVPPDTSGRSRGPGLSGWDLAFYVVEAIRDVAKVAVPWVGAAWIAVPFAEALRRMQGTSTGVKVELNVAASLFEGDPVPILVTMVLFCPEPLPSHSGRLSYDRGSATRRSRGLRHEPRRSNA